MYRGSDEKKLYEISKSSNVPIINGLTNQSHPCQIIADLMTLEENFKNINKINICWLVMEIMFVIHGYMQVDIMILI